MAEAAPKVVVDPIEEALAQQMATWEADVATLTERIAGEQALLKRMQASQDELGIKIGKVKSHLDEQYEGWDVRAAERAASEEAGAKRGRS